MKKIIEDLLSIAKTFVPTSPVIKVAENVLQTIANPSLENVSNDFELAKQIVEEIRQKVGNENTRLIDLIKALL